MTTVARRRLRWGLACAGVLAGSWLGLNEEPRRTGRAADEAAVYALALRMAADAAPVPELVRWVESTPVAAIYMTGTPGEAREYGWLRREFPRVRASTVADFTRRQPDRASLRDVLPRGWFPLSRSPRLLEDEPARYSLSNIGFDSERTQAVVYVSHVCGETCGMGSYLFLERTGTRWRISQAFMAWIS